MKQRLQRRHFANNFTILLFFGILIPPSVLEAQKLSTDINHNSGFNPIAYLKALSQDNKAALNESLLNLKTETKEANNPLICYTITTPSPATQSVCVGALGTNITVKTSTNIGGGIRFVRFLTDQMAGASPTVTESNFLYSYSGGYKDLAYVTATGGSSPYTATYTFYPDDFPNTTNAPITYFVYAVFNNGAVNSTCSPNPAVEIQVTVKPKPIINAIADQYVCAGSSTTAVTLTGSTVASSTYAWTNTTTSIGLATSGATTVPAFTAVNATASPVTATVTATATASSCVSDPKIFKIVAYPASSTMISGVAFNDLNQNGIRESAEGVQEGIVVKVYNSSGTLAGTSTTAANGFWSVSGLTFGGATDKYRVEFSIPTALSTAGLKPALNGTSNKTDVQFVSAASCNINFGVNYSSSYSSSNPILATPCYTNGSRVDNSSDAAVILYKYNDRGQNQPHESIATIGEVGSVWGETYNPANKKLYVSAFIKRHSDLSPNGLGAIYEIDLTTPTTAGAGTPILWLDINAATFVNQSNVAVNLGLPADPGAASRGLGVKTLPNRDNWAFDRVGKQGIGDIELSEDGLRLYVMDLTNRQVLCIDYATKKLIWKLAVSTPTCLGGSSDIRPWGLKEHNGVLYVGAICSGETNKNSTQLHYYVMKCNSLTAATSMSLAVDMGTSVTKQDGNTWQYWVSNPADVGMTTLPDGGYINYPEPMISDIEFDKDDNMIIGVMDRVGHQTGRSNYIPNVTNNNLVTGIANGDITRALKSGSTFTNETAPWSYFYLTAAIPAPPDDQFEGGLIVSNASGENLAVAHMIDPFGYESAGTTWLKTSTGQMQGGTKETGRLEIVPIATSVATFGKANGLGDLTLLENAAPIEIGNFIWYDADKDGQQDATEAPLSNVTVELWKNNAKIASAVTSATGEYYFSNKNASGVTWIGTGADTVLRPSMAYELKVYSKQTKLDTTVLTLQDNTLNSGNDQNDSDAFIRGDSAIISLTTGVAGTTNHTYDFGFTSKPCEITLNTSVSDCYDSNGNAAGGTSVATVQVIVDWFNNISGQTINVTCTGATAQAISSEASIKPAVLTFTVPANGSTVTVTATFSTTTTCTATQNVTAPAGTCTLTPCVAGNTGGQVWRDYTNNGVKDVSETLGLGGVTVKAFDCTGNLVGTTTTDYLGQYTFGTLSPVPSTTNKYRIEFSNIPPQYKPTFNGTNGRTDVQFIEAASCAVDLGVNSPNDYCQVNPDIITTCFVHGRPTGSGNATVVKFPNTAANQVNENVYLADAENTGSVWGVAYDRTNKKIYTAAFLKRHVGMKDNDSNGKEDIGAIYSLNTTGSPSLWLDLATLGVDVGLSLMPTVAQRNLPTNSTDPSVDSSMFDLVGKIGLGDLDISDDGQFLYVVNLYDKKLYTINVATKTLVGSGLAVPSACTGGISRPFALKYNKGDIYVGSICDGQAAQDTSLMDAYVYRLKAGETAFTNILTFPLSYTKGTVEAGFGVQWYPWKTDFYPEEGIPGSNYYYIYPQPMLSDIEIDAKGGLILGFMDRLGHQLGFRNYGTNSTDATLYEGEIGGDILRADLVKGVYVLENNGTSGGITTSGANNNEGPGGGEFYYEELYDPYHRETVEGGFAVQLGQNLTVVNTMDPFDIYSGGTSWMNNLTGQTDKKYEIFPNAAPGTFAKANGLGDLELLCSTTPIQIGNYVWIDTNKDGVQDPCEVPLSNITVSLWKSGTQIASTSTNANGEYYFSDKNAVGVTWTGTGADTMLLQSMAYEIRIDTSNQTKFDTLKLTTANATANNGNDQNDSDASVMGNYAIITLTTGTVGSTNHTYDFGFIPVCAAPSIANIVADTATCTNGVANSDAAVHVMGITGMAKYAYSTNGTTSLFASSAIASTASSIDITGLANPSVATTYTFRIYASDSTCYNDTMVVLTPSVCPIPCSPITMTPNPLPDGQVGTPYSVQIGATGGTSPYQFLWLVGSSGTLPGGLSMSTSGLVSGTPTTVGSYAVKIVVKDTHECPDTLDPAAITIAPACAVTPTWTQNTCNNNSTTANITDDYFTVTVSATAVSGGASGKYEVILNGTVLNVGGTAYGTSVTVGTTTTFKADGATTYQLTVRDLDNPACVSSIFTTTATANCSVILCPPQICLPITVTRMN